MDLEKVRFDPTESVTFLPDPRKQAAVLTIHNLGSKTLIFKMKSTRPGLYKMRPTFGRVPAGSSTPIQLIFVGLQPTQPVPLNDHFTCMYTTVEAADVDSEKCWKDEKWLRGKRDDIKKWRINILYMGHNDPETTAAQENIQREEFKKPMVLSFPDIEPTDSPSTKARKKPGKPVVELSAVRPSWQSKESATSPSTGTRSTTSSSASGPVAKQTTTYKK